jgi:hypothetical protein
MIFLSMILFLITAQLVSATPVIENINILPSSTLWLIENKNETTEDATITLNCYDTENKTINKVYANITGPVILTPNEPWNFNCVGNTCNLIIDSIYLDRIGQYNAEIFCENNESNIATNYTNFRVSELTGYINFINPNPAYIGDLIEIDFIVMKDGVKIPSGVEFNVTLNDQLKSFKVDNTYANERGWILKIDSPSTEGAYNLKIYAFYDRAKVSDYDNIEVRKKIDFEIVSLSKNWVDGNENITLALRAKDGANVIDVNKNNLNIQIASVNLNILSIEKNGDLYNVKITTPAVSAGTYEVRATLNYGSTSYSSIKSIDYIVSVKGKIIDSDNKGINTQIKFFSSGIEKLKISTDSTGCYSSTLPPGVYDVEVTFPQSVLYLKGVSISDFNDPVKYFYSTDPIVPGIRNAGLFSYEIALTYYETEVEMDYEEKNLFDETNIVIFKCSSWNSGRKICNNKWFEIGGNIDSIRNSVKLNLNSLSAFIIGEKKSINANYNLDSQKYYIESTVKVRGILKDLDGDAVTNGTIKAYVKNTEIKVETTSDNNGVFSFEFKAPKEEGNYALVLSAEKTPYKSFSDSKSFDVLKSRTMEVLIPDTIKLKQGQNATQEFSIINTGQADFTNLNISLLGIPSNYYNMTNYIERLKESEENKIYIRFSIPEDAAKETYSATISVFNGEIKKDKVFGITITGKNETTAESVSTPSGRFILPITLPKLDSNMVYVIIFAIICFSTAIILKKIKVKKSKRDDIKNFLFDVKDHLRKRKIEMITIRNEIDYKKLILSEFPNAIKNLRDERGKNN